MDHESRDGLRHGVSGQTCHHEAEEDDPGHQDRHECFPWFAVQLELAVDEAVSLVVLRVPKRDGVVVGDVVEDDW